MTRVGWRTRALFGACTVTALAIVAGLPFYVFPVTDAPTRTDAVLILGPAFDSRVDLANELIAGTQLSDELVISVPETGDRSAAEWSICDSTRMSPEVLCFHADPFTTLGEARGFAELARKRGWDSVAVITATTHVTRARVLIERCFPGEVYMIADDSGLTPWKFAWQYIYQTGAFVKAAVFTPDCPAAQLTFHDSNSEKHPS